MGVEQGRFNAVVFAAMAMPTILLFYSLTQPSVKFLNDPIAQYKAKRTFPVPPIATPCEATIGSTTRFLMS